MSDLYAELDAREPYVEIRRGGRWTYHVSVVHGICCWGPDGRGWIVLGRKRAERKAPKALRAYAKYQERAADVRIFTPPPGPSGVSAGTGDGG